MRKITTGASATNMYNFASIHMARNFLPLYEKVLNGESLNPRPPKLLDPDPPKFLPWFQ